MNAPTLSDIDDAMQIQEMEMPAGYRDEPHDDEEDHDSFSEEDEVDELDNMMAASIPKLHTTNPSSKKSSYLTIILVGLAVTILLVELLRGKDGSLPLNVRTKGFSGDLSTSSSAGDKLTIEFTVANLRTNSQNCTHIGKMLQCIPQHNNATNKFRIQLHESWAPIGVKRFQELTEANFWDDARIFRIVPNFVSQFGISSFPDVQKYYDSLGNLEDDKVVASNKRGTITFANAGPNTRTTQVFINTADNSFLDRQGFSPIGEVLPAGDDYGSMEVVDEMCSKYGEEPDQGMIEKNGKDYLEENYPSLSYFVTAVFV